MRYFFFLCVTVTQDNRASWQRWVYICLPTLDCSSCSIGKHGRAQKRSISEAGDDHASSNHNTNRNLIPLYHTCIGVAKVTYHICHIISIILLLCSELSLPTLSSRWLKLITGLHFTGRGSVVDQLVVVQRP